jgi:hypothetical protein
MTEIRLAWGGMAMALLAFAVTGGVPVEAQDAGLPLRPVSPEGRPVVPFMEGWYDNGDGSVTITFGYYNANQEDVVEIPLGEANYLEPARFDGMQPTVFHPGRQHGAFGVTLPEEMRDQDVWWYITNADGEVYKVPGRARVAAYQLDRTPRPHGTVPPLVWFEDEDRQGSGPEGVVAEGMETVSVGTPLTLEVSIRDPSVRDQNDPRLRDGVPVHVIWIKHQGPGDVTYTRHESMPEPEPEESGRGRRGGGRGGSTQRLVRLPLGPQEFMLPEGQGTVRVNATFSEPGDYILRAQVDNWRALDSGAMDQCCWSNGYVRVHVTP